MSKATVTVVERQTRAGLLVVTVDDRGRMGSTIDGREIGLAIGKLPTPVSVNGSTYTHAIGGRYAISASESAAIEEAIAAAKAAFAATPRGQRQALTDELARCERDAFPGSAAYRRESAALTALADFDDQHPEVLAEIMAEGRQPDPWQ